MEDRPFCLEPLNGLMNGLTKLYNQVELGECLEVFYFQQVP